MDEPTTTTVTGRPGVRIPTTARIGADRRSRSDMDATPSAGVDTATGSAATSPDGADGRGSDGRRPGR